MLSNLIDMGFDSERARRALDATGFHSVDAACVQLLTHGVDNMLDEAKDNESAVG